MLLRRFSQKTISGRKTDNGTADVGWDDGLVCVVYSPDAVRTAPGVPALALEVRRTRRHPTNIPDAASKQAHVRGEVEAVHSAGGRSELKGREDTADDSRIRIE